ncbi:hypothetical protein ACJMK2_017424 [Sinanodonta woodiana]|uniref:Uncharacterized protein n=1 Tax=Sinanodonta woodiana TaxID=1069815 RepID=A0ABD3UDA2_SINWO
MDCVIRGTNLRNSVLLRYCICTPEKDKSMLANKASLQSSEFGDGVEIHLYTDENEPKCEYRKAGEYLENGELTYKISKVCFCPRKAS